MKRNKNLRDLSSDHHQALALVRDIMKACRSDTCDGQFIERVQTLFRTELEPHFDLEESLLLPELGKAKEVGLVNRTLADHRHLRHLASRLRETDTLMEFALALQAHVRFEERELFEVSQQVLDDAVLAGIGQGLGQRHAMSGMVPVTLENE